MEEETVLECGILGTTIAYPARPSDTVSVVSTRVYEEYRQLLRYKKPMRVKVLIRFICLLPYAFTDPFYPL